MTILDDPRALDELDRESTVVPVEDDLPVGDGQRGPVLEEWEQEPPLPALRVGLVVACPVIAAGIAVGTIFEGVAAKVVPSVAGIVGIAVAVNASRRRTVLAANLIILGGIVAAGLVLVVPTGIGNVTGLVDELRAAAAARKVLRPPAEFLPGFRAIVGWVMVALGFAAGWIAIEMRRPAIALLAPLPVLVIAAISVPAEAKVRIGIVVLVLFLFGLTFLSSLQGITSPGETAPSLGYELRRAARIIPLIAVLVAVLVVLARSNLLFPPPLYDPVREAQRPKAVPLSSVEDRVLFEVRSRSTGPWRIGLLDVYDGEAWRLPAFAESELKRVPASGIVDPTLTAATRADFLVKGLSGAVLPGLPNSVAIVANGPRLGFDERTGNIRLAEGQIRTGLTYTVTGAPLPTEEQLRAVDYKIPKSIARFREMPDPPPAVRALLTEAPANAGWDRLDFVRRRLLETVTAAGPGTPVAVPPAKVDDMLVGSKEASPFEIVAAQAMLARWAGIPARIGYGYDGGDVLSENVRELRPRHGASWLEVWFPDSKWVPVIGAPLKAKPNLASEGPSNENPHVEPSDEIAAQVVIPLRVEGRSHFYDQVRRLVLLAIPLLVIGGLVYLLWPAAWKAWRRRRRRAWAVRAGPVTRIEVAYAEFRDYCRDLGLPHPSATPIGFLRGFADDREHLELAWLVTRILYGDLRDDVRPEDAHAAEEMSRSLRRRLAATHPVSLRMIAWVSRLSVRDPYAPNARRPSRKERHALAA